MVHEFMFQTFGSIVIKQARKRERLTGALLKNQHETIPMISFELLKAAFAQTRAFALLRRINKNPQHTSL